MGRYHRISLKSDFLLRKDKSRKINDLNKQLPDEIAKQVTTTFGVPHFTNSRYF